MARITNSKIMTFLQCIGLLYFTSCTAQEPYRDTITFMVIDSCKDVAIEYFGNLDPAVKIEYSYHEFGFKFDSHPEVVGYMKLSSDLKRKHGLDGYVSSVRSLCYPNAFKRVSRKDSNYPEQVFELIEFEEMKGIKQFFINVKEDEVVVRFREKGK